MSIIKNLEDFKNNKEVYEILCALERAHTNKDDLSASILLKRLKNYNLVLETSCEESKNLVQ